MSSGCCGSNAIARFATAPEIAECAMPAPAPGSANHETTSPGFANAVKQLAGDNHATAFASLPRTPHEGGLGAVAELVDKLA